jgi:hypothetical protein
MRNLQALNQTANYIKSQACMQQRDKRKNEHIKEK